MSVSNYRRYCLLKAVAARKRGDLALVGVWKAKQAASSGTPLPSDFPVADALAAAGYTTREDIVGSSLRELQGIACIESRDAADVAEALEKLMGYSMANGRWADTTYVALFVSEGRGASMAGSAFEIGDRGTLRLDLDVSAVAAPGTLTVAVETRESGDAEWRPAGTFGGVAAVGSLRRSFVGMDRFIRAVATIEGGPFTFGVTGEAV